MNTATATSRKLIRVFVGDRSYAFALEVVESVVRHEAETKPASRFVYRGAELPLKHLAAELGLTCESPKQAYIVVVRTAKGLLGYRVDRTAQAKEYPADAVIPAVGLLKRVAGHRVVAMIRTGEEYLFQLDVNALLTPLKRDENSLVPKSRTPREPVRAQQLVILQGAASPGARPISLGIPATLVHEVAALPPWQEVADGGVGFLGLVTWNKTALPIIDPFLRLGLGRTLASYARLLVVGVPGMAQPVGLVTPGQIHVRDLPLPHAPCKRDFSDKEVMLRGSVELKQETLVVPDLLALMA